MADKIFETQRREAAKNAKEKTKNQVTTENTECTENKKARKTAYKADT